MESTNSKSNRPKFLIAALLLLCVAGIGYFWATNQSLDSENQKLNATNQELTGEVVTLKELRNDLLQDIETLQQDYEKTLASNDSLAVLFEETTMEVAKKKKEIKKIKTDFAKDATGLNTEIAQLRSIKKELTAMVSQLKNENTQLKQSNEELNSKVVNAESRNRELEFHITELLQLNSDLEKERKNLMATSTRANNIRVDIRKRGGKDTGSARRAKEIKVSFDINNLPENKNGVHNIYLVIKDAKGLPVKVANPVKATIKPDTGSQSEQIIAQQMIKADLYEKNRLQFTITPESGSLHTGYYRAVIYADWGLLGGAQFQLR